MAEREVKQWITVNGKHVPIFDGETEKQAINRAIAKDNEDIKEKQIAKNKEQVSKYVANNSLKDQVQKIQDAYSDKSLSNEDKSKIMSEFKTYLNENVQISEKSAPIGSHILNVTGNRAWYRNKSGTIVMLAPNGEWLKFNNDLSVTRDGKIDANTKARVQSLAEQLHSKKQ